MKGKTSPPIFSVLTPLLLLLLLQVVLAQQEQGVTEERCGDQAKGAVCSGHRCCSHHGYCGTTDAYCGKGCQSQCCGQQAGGIRCPGDLCCSIWGFCGSSDLFCGATCQSQCRTPPGPSPPPPPPVPNPPPPPPPVPSPPPPVPSPAPAPSAEDDLSSIVTKEQFEEMLLHRNAHDCAAHGFYTYNAFLAAAKGFPEFASTGNVTTRKREVAAFFGQTSHVTKGGWASAPDGPYAWGYCVKAEPVEVTCIPTDRWPCVEGKKYYGRGPFLLFYNYNYGPAGEAIGVDLLKNPDLVETDPIISFKTAIWFWMTKQPPKPSCHDVMTGQWTPSSEDIAANRLPRYGLCTNIVDDDGECGHGPDEHGKSRIGFYKRFCGIIGVEVGDNLDCYDQSPFGHEYGRFWSIV